jgi:glutamine amidotransferase
MTPQAERSKGRRRVAIVDYCAGNLFSVVQACVHVGLLPVVTSDRRQVMQCDALILPGVGAFGEAMASLARLDMIKPLCDFAASGKPFAGICLGMQLLMSESEEFGRHAGLGLIAGDVRRLPDGAARVPNVGWRRIRPPRKAPNWSHASLCDLPSGAWMYFVHSYHVRPLDENVVLAETEFGQARFCSSLARGNIWAFQFHPEKSGPMGLTIYRRIASAAAGINQRETCHAA